MNRYPTLFEKAYFNLFWAVQIVFIVLKLMGRLGWSWFWVLLPVIIMTALLIVFFTLVHLW